jgi:archaellum biogenesis protein FlaJ (TadC family)
MQWNVLNKLKKLKIWKWNSTTSEANKTSLNLDHSKIAEDSKSLYEGNMEQAISTKEKLTFYVTMIVSATLCLCMLAMVGAFLVGLWAKEVDNASIFALIGPAFQTIVGGMIGFLSGVKLMQGDEKDKK